MALSAQDRARKIKIILFDVDGVWTDGTIWLVPGAGPADGRLLDEIRGKETMGSSVNSDYHGRSQRLQRPRRHLHLARPARRPQVRHHYQAHQRDRGHTRTRPETRIRLPGLRLQDAGHPRDRGERRRHARRDLLRGRRRHRPAAHAQGAASPWPWPTRASR